MSEKKIPLVELFGPTIQGEGAVIGQQTYFLRLGLCDYKCTLCDSMNAVDPNQVKENAQWLTQREIFEAFYAFRNPNTTHWLTLSGGNPCIHDLEELVANLSAFKVKIAVETQGTKCPNWLRHCDIITVSPKGPGMGEKTDIKELRSFLETCNTLGVLQSVNIKIVAFDQRDLEFIKLVYEAVWDYGVPFYISLGNPYPPGYRPEHHPTSHAEHLEALLKQYRVLFEDIQRDPILSNMRFLPQWHVFVWGNQKGK